MNAKVFSKNGGWCTFNKDYHPQGYCTDDPDIQIGEKTFEQLTSDLKGLGFSGKSSLNELKEGKVVYAEVRRLPGGSSQCQKIAKITHNLRGSG